ncbi:MAG: hypothetical protein HYZ29_30430, partial [Myxococcales bacterium]|nr:hypothetical protein [Myxococcales bacterium]
MLRLFAASVAGLLALGCSSEEGQSPDPGTGGSGAAGSGGASTGGAGSGGAAGAGGG